MKRLAAAVLLSACANGAVAQAPVCILPEKPWVPVSEADFREYADLVAADFERYFSALTRHFQCLEQAWQDGLDRGRRVAADREAFAARAKTLGLQDRIGVDSLIDPEAPK
jgi:hypothetical protein